MRIKKPLIRQAGSAEAFVGSAATGREHHLLYGYRPFESSGPVSFLVLRHAPRTVAQVQGALLQGFMRSPTAAPLCLVAVSPVEEVI